MPSGLFYLSLSLDKSITAGLNANKADPDQTGCSAAFDLGLHYLPLSLL